MIMVFFRPMADWLRKPGRSASENGTQDSKDSFNKFQDQTKDAWDCADDEVVKNHKIYFLKILYL